MSSAFQHPYAQALAWALVHFIWQGAAIALVLVVMQRLGRLSATARYTTGVLAMAAMLIAPALTFARLATTTHVAPATTSARPTPAATHLATAVDTIASSPRISAPASSGVTPPSLLPAIVLTMWSIGVIVLSLRLFGGWLVAQRLARRALSPASAEIQALAHRVAGRLALDRVVGVFESSAVSVPMMIGWIKPVVLLPAAAMAGLSMSQVEALLAHELAHVRRHDYLVNLLQSAVETLLFYHPAVWFVSQRMRVDREHCCDDLALHVCDRVVYATALSDLATMARTPRVALAATDGPLLNRVRRILGQPTDRQDAGSGWLSACMVVLLVASIAPAALTKDTQTPDVQGGVSSGVAGGVPGGVATGVTTGVAGGVQSGVTAGAPGGVAGGVASGVVGGVRDDAATYARLESQARPIEVQPEPARAEQVQTEEQKARDAKLRDLEAQLQKVQQDRVENELRRAEAKSTARLGELEEQLKRLRDEQARVSRQVAAGTVSESDLKEIESRIAIAQKQMQAEHSEMDYQKVEMTLKLRQLALELEAREKGLKDVGSLELRELRSVEVAAAQEFKVAEAKQAAEQAAFLKKLEVAQAAESSTVALEPNAAARAGDIVFVQIHSEPDLPSSYVVQQDGTIRFPFLGAIRVQGLTAKQIEAALAKQLADRKLTGSGIGVTLRREK